MNRRTNRLAGEKSPYLLQHSSNPVDWYPWGEEAFRNAQKEDKPIFLSIGYSTCHWCHVMAHESFEDASVAALMNDDFISIKVDREERPDIDMQYMRVCQMMTGSGGWPLSIVMTPDKQPFFAATYIPRETRFGRAGLIDLIPRLANLWKIRREEVVASARQIVAGLEQAPDSSSESPGEAELDLCYEQLAQTFDEEWGGFGLQPKFPSAHNLIFLLRYWKRTGRQGALEMVERTLQSLQRGGICDHIGGGFHRYSTDRKWLVPHFEKMIYDQALLVSAFIEAYQATGKEAYALTARAILAYILRDMTGPTGGFYTAEDADSEGQEGKFYLWTPQEVTSILGAEDSELFLRAFNITKGGNFVDEATGNRTGKSIPYLSRSIEEIASDARIAVAEAQRRLDEARRRLFALREKRVHPQKDDKVLTDWNGLVVGAMAQAARVFDDPTYLHAAELSVQFLLNQMLDSEGRLLHHYRDGHAGTRGTVDDYAFFVHGLLELYETTFDAGYLKSALAFNRQLTEHFEDRTGGGMYFTADDGEVLLSRQKEFYDGALPSGNSVAMLNMVRLSHITGDAGLEEEAARIVGALGSSMQRAPSAYTQMMVALDFALGPSYEVVVAGDPAAEDTRKMLRALNSSYVPRKVVVLTPAPGDDIDVADLAPYLRQYRRVGGKATAYVCVNGTCHSPTSDLATMLRVLETPQL